MTKAVMGVRKFRETFPHLTEPTEVIRATKGMERLGVWYPNEDRATTTHSGTSSLSIGSANYSVTSSGSNVTSSTTGSGTD